MGDRRGGDEEVGHSKRIAKFEVCSGSRSREVYACRVEIKIGGSIVQAILVQVWRLTACVAEEMPGRANGQEASNGGYAFSSDRCVRRVRSAGVVREAVV